MTRPFSKRWRRARRRSLKAAASIGTGVAIIGGLGVAAAASGGFGTNQVGTTYPQGILLPTNQYINPIGTRLLVNDGRLLSSSISPNGQFLAALSWRDFTGFLTIIDLTKAPSSSRWAPARAATPPSGTAPWRPTGRCGRPTARRSGFPSRPTWSASAFPAPAWPATPRSSSCRPA